MEKIRDVIKDTSSTASILIIMFFCLRIMFLRTSDSIFNETFGLIWPVLYTVLVQIFNDELIPGNLNLKLAALKLLEMIMVIDHENIYLHYWAFGFDYPEIKLSEKTENRIRPFTNQFPFLPFLTKLVKKNVELDCVVEADSIDKDYIKKIKGVRKIVVKVNRVESEEELSNITLEFMEYVVKMNSLNLQIDQEDINDVITEDFIRLNEFINK